MCLCVWLWPPYLLSASSRLSSFQLVILILVHIFFVSSASFLHKAPNNRKEFVFACCFCSSLPAYANSNVNSKNTRPSSGANGQRIAISAGRGIGLLRDGKRALPWIQSGIAFERQKHDFSRKLSIIFRRCGAELGRQQRADQRGQFGRHSDLEHCVERALHVDGPQANREFE